MLRNVIHSNAILEQGGNGWGLHDAGREKATTAEIIGIEKMGRHRKGSCEPGINFVCVPSTRWCRLSRVSVFVCSMCPTSEGCCSIDIVNSYSCTDFNQLRLWGVCGWPPPAALETGGYRALREAMHLSLSLLSGLKRLTLSLSRHSLTRGRACMMQDLWHEIRLRKMESCEKARVLLEHTYIHSSSRLETLSKLSWSLTCKSNPGWP